MTAPKKRAKSAEAQLPPRLEALLAAHPDREFATRFHRVIEAAAQAIDRLGQLGLIKLEPTHADEGSADLGLWEKMAPAVADTVVAINALLQVIIAEFPDSQQPSSAPYSPNQDPSEAEAERVFGAVARRLERGITEVGGMVRNPDLLSSSWGLVGELQRLRAVFRTRIGDAVYLAAAACAPVCREDVVPGFVNELERGTLFRRTTADVLRNMNEKLASESTAPKLIARNIDADLEIFASLPAYRYVSAEPKREMLRLREALQRAAMDEAVTRVDVKRLVQPGVELLRSLAEEQSKNVLATHDRNVRTLVGELLEQAVLHVELDTGAAQAAIERAVAGCAGLYGRDERFDALLRGMRGKALKGLSAEELHKRAVTIGQLLAALQI